MGERERALPTCSLLKGMNIIWSAEAIADLISLRAYSPNTVLPPLVEWRSGSSN